MCPADTRSGCVRSNQWQMSSYRVLADRCSRRLRRERSRPCHRRLRRGPPRPASGPCPWTLHRRAAPRRSPCRPASCRFGGGCWNGMRSITSSRRRPKRCDCLCAALSVYEAVPALVRRAARHVQHDAVDVAVVIRRGAEARAYPCDRRDAGSPGRGRQRARGSPRRHVSDLVLGPSVRRNRSLGQMAGSSVSASSVTFSGTRRSRCHCRRYAPAERRGTNAFRRPRPGLFGPGCCFRRAAGMKRSSSMEKSSCVM